MSNRWCGKKGGKSMKKCFMAIVFLVLLLVFNPGIDAHREALLPYVQKCFNEAYHESGFWGKIDLAFMGDDIKSLILNSLYRRSYGIFSLGYIDDKIATIGILGCVYVLG